MIVYEVALPLLQWLLLESLPA